MFLKKKALNYLLGLPQALVMYPVSKHTQLSQGSAHYSLVVLVLLTSLESKKQPLFCSATGFVAPPLHLLWKNKGDNRSLRRLWVIWVSVQLPWLMTMQKRLSSSRALQPSQTRPSYDSMIQSFRITCEPHWSLQWVQNHHTFNLHRSYLISDFTV